MSMLWQPPVIACSPGLPPSRFLHVPLSRGGTPTSPSPHTLTSQTHSPGNSWAALTVRCSSITNPASQPSSGSAPCAPAILNLPQPPPPGSEKFSTGSLPRPQQLPARLLSCHRRPAPLPPMRGTTLRPSPIPPNKSVRFGHFFGFTDY